MARLILLRHAAAEPYASTDAERPLSAHGRKEAHDIGKRLRALGWMPDNVVTSHALRARQTADLVLQAMDVQLAPHVEEGLYFGGPAQYLATSGGDCVLVVGHNPSIGQAASQLAARAVSMGTAWAACFEGGRLAHLARPDA